MAATPSSTRAAVQSAPWALGLLGLLLMAPGVGAMPPWSEVEEIGQRLRSNLEAPARARIHPTVIRRDSSESMILCPSTGHGGVVLLSGVLVDFVDHLAQAQAYDRVRHGYLKEYLAALEGWDGRGRPPPLPDHSDSRYQTLAVENAHRTSFNQVLGGLIGVALARLELGQVDAEVSIPAPATGGAGMSRRPPERAWRRAFDAGIQNAVKCAYGVEGLSDFFFILDRLKNAGAWRDVFLPYGLRGRELARDAERIQVRILK